MKFRETQPWKFLDDFRGKEFEGTWPDIKTMFHISCLRYPDNLCFRVFSPSEETFTYREAEVACLLDYGLLSEGVQKGDRIGVSGKNSPEWCIAYLGIIYAGAIVVPLDYSLKDQEMEHLISFGGVSRLFIDKERIGRIDPEGKAGLKAQSTCICTRQGFTGLTRQYYNWRQSTV